MAPRHRLRRAAAALGFHLLDGAWHLQEDHWPEPIAGLVAHHSAARLVAAVRGLTTAMSCFPAGRYACGPLPTR